MRLYKPVVAVLIQILSDLEAGEVHQAYYQTSITSHSVAIGITGLTCHYPMCRM